MILPNELTRSYEDKCTQNYPPGCIAMCPVHVDVKAMIRHLESQDWDAALKVFYKSVPFPRIISRICDHPCQDHCKRQENGGAILIAELEKTCVNYGEISLKVNKPFKKNNLKIAIIGAGLCGLTAALILYEKGYDVDLYEKNGKAGGSVWKYSAEMLPVVLIEQDLQVIQNTDINIYFNTTVENQLFSKIKAEHGAVLLASGAFENDFGIDRDENGVVVVDSKIFQTSMPSVFAGGSIINQTKCYSPILSISDGKRTAVSLDRFLKNVSLLEGRGQMNEGQYESMLFTNTAAFPPAEPVFANDKLNGLSKDEATREAARCMQCECLECLKICPFLDFYDGYPKKQIREIANSVNVIHGLRKGKIMANSCTDCGLCKKVCPNELDMGEFCCTVAKTELVNNGDMPPAIHDFPINDMLFSNSDKFELFRHQKGRSSSKYLFFPGCQLPAANPDYVIKAYNDLTSKLSDGVGICLRCCGAPALWAGRTELVDEAMQEFYKIWQEAGKPIVVYACSSCAKMIKEKQPDIELVSIWEVFAKYGLPEAASAQAPNKMIALHDPCTSRDIAAIQTSVRSVLTQIGYEIEELKYSKDHTKCCGYGGLVFFSNRAMAKEMINTRINESAKDYVVYCSMCQDYFASEGKTAWHLLDLIYSPDNLQNIADKKSITYSQRHENRAKLKNKLLKEVWAEMYRENGEDSEKLELVITDEVEKIMAERLILRSDVQNVIFAAESSGDKVCNPQNNRYTASLKPGVITYWVEYNKEDDRYIIVNAYSHRLEIKE